jgi:RNA polymerase subunit RPABC4/transcription elongation factor Spt4
MVRPLCSTAELRFQDLEVQPMVITRDYRRVTCHYCATVIPLQQVKCPVCDWTGPIQKTRIWNGIRGLTMTNPLTFRRCCPHCPLDRPSFVVDVWGNKVCFPPPRSRGDCGETDERRHGIRRGY